MLLTEESLRRAIKVFLREAKIPCPDRWSKIMDAAYQDIMVVPAFLKALQEIERVDTCAGFNLANVQPSLLEKYG